MNDSIQQIIDELAPHRKTTGATWGTKYDFIDKVPGSRMGLSFYQMDHEDIEEFLMSDDEEKFKMAYWAERYREDISSKYHFRIGIFFGILLGLIVSFLISRI